MGGDPTRPLAAWSTTNEVKKHKETKPKVNEIILALGIECLYNKAVEQNIMLEPLIGTVSVLAQETISTLRKKPRRKK